MRSRSSNNWSLFIKELSNIIFFWFFGVMYFLLFRWTFWGIYSDQISCKARFVDFIKATYAGFRFDCMAVSYFIVLPLAILIFIPHSYHWAGKTRRVIQKIFIVLSTLICVGTLNYFAEYNEQFNNFLFMGLFDEDKTAIAMSILKDYNPVLNVLAIATVITICWILLNRFERGERIATLLNLATDRFLWSKMGLVILVIVCYVFSMRGSITSIMGRRSAGVTADAFLNKTVINPIRMMSYAYKDYKALNSSSHGNPYGPLDAKNESEEILNKKLIRKTTTGLNMNHQQVFLIVMESYDSWPLMEKYRGLGVSSNLAKYADEGIHFTHFLPAYNATFYAMGTTTSGIPFSGVDMSATAKVAKPYKTSLFKQMKGLDYSTNLFYGGFPSWHQLGDFVTNLGVDSCYYAADIPNTIGYSEWGVEDEALFDLVLDKVNPDSRTMNIILTTSYHTPFEVDVESKGFPYKNVSDLPKAYQEIFDGSMSLNELGHLWYGDFALGKFVEQAQAKFPDAVFVFTGDHYGRRFINANPTAYERSSVPLIIYGRGIEPARLDTPGAHMDILATLLDMESPKGTQYYGFGKSMFDETKKYGIGFGKVITRESIYIMDDINGVTKTNLKTLEEEQFEEFPEAFNYMQLLRASWQYSAKGTFKGTDGVVQ